VDLSPLELDLDDWNPWSPTDVAERLRSVNARWYVLAGWALDLFLGRQTRAHEDLEIGVRQEDFTEIRSALAGFEFVVVGSGQAWPVTDETLAVHRQTWVREPGGPWRLDVVRERWDGDHWIYRRDARIRLAAPSVVAWSPAGIPFLRPELALLFKAKATRPKDVADFEMVLPHLDAGRRSWLRDALAMTHPHHPWLDELA
jgi:hypothetical protein